MASSEEKLQDAVAGSASVELDLSNSTAVCWQIHKCALKASDTRTEWHYECYIYIAYI